MLIVGEQVEFHTTFQDLDRVSKFASFDRHGIGDVCKTMLGKRTRLFERRYCDRAVMTLGLYSRDLDTLVRLNMRPQADVVSMRCVTHSRGILADALDIKQKARSTKAIHRNEDIILVPDDGHLRGFYDK